MDRVIVGLKQKSSRNKIETLLFKSGIQILNELSDIEVEDGLSQFCSVNKIAETFVLIKNLSDDSSNLLTQELYSELSYDSEPRLVKFVRKVEKTISCDIWLMFAYSWRINDEISYFFGSSNQFLNYLKNIIVLRMPESIVFSPHIHL